MPMFMVMAIFILAIQTGAISLAALPHTGGGVFEVPLLE
jgi:hypothetical protein